MVGAMMKIVRNIASAIITWFGGSCWVESALRMNENTIAIRVNEVTEMMMAGARLSTVRRKRISRDSATSRGRCASSTVMPILGIGMRSWAELTPGESRSRSRTSEKKGSIPHLSLFRIRFKFPSRTAIT